MNFGYEMPIKDVMQQWQIRYIINRCIDKLHELI